MAGLSVAAAAAAVGSRSGGGDSSSPFSESRAGGGDAGKEGVKLGGRNTRVPKRQGVGTVIGAGSAEERPHVSGFRGGGTARCLH